MGNFGLNAARDMVSKALTDPYSPGKVDKFEAIDIKEKLTGKGAEPSESAKAFLADQIQAGKFDQGAAAVMQDIFAQPTQNFDKKVYEQADIAIKALHKALDFGFVGGVHYDNSVSGSENSADVAGMAEKYLQKLKELGSENSNLHSIIGATLEGGKLIKDPEKRLNSYLTTLADIRGKFNNNDQDMKRLAADAIQNIHTAVRSRGGVVSVDGSINNLSSESIYSGAFRQLENIRNKSSNEFIQNQAKNGLEAAASAARGSYESATNIMLETLANISRGSAPRVQPAQPARPGKTDLTVETTVTTRIKQ